MKIHKTAIVHPGAQIGQDVEIGPHAIVGEGCVIGTGTKVGAYCVLDGWTEIGQRCQIYPGAIIGTAPQHLEDKGEGARLIIGNDNIIREYSTINRGTNKGTTRIGNNNYLMAYSHVGHDCIVGSGIIMANGVSLGGHVTLEDYVNIGGHTPVHQFNRLGAYAIVGGGFRVNMDVVPYVSAAGYPLKIHGLNTVGLRRSNFSSEAISILKEAYRILFRSGLNVSQAIERIEREVARSKEIVHLLQFLKTSTRGICR
jgi:UDP-N-acetylglucosamine acyltransferase